jgi:hypothetical protein
MAFSTCADPQIRPQRGKMIAARVTLDKLATKAFLQGRDPSLNRRLAQSQELRGTERASRRGLRSSQLNERWLCNVCRSVQQPCGYRLAA